MMKILKPDLSTDIDLLLYSSKVQAGFPSPAENHIEAKLDFNKYLIDHPAATFLTRVVGNSMINAGIYENDILVVDRSLEATDNKIVVAVVNNELTVKRLKYINGKAFLVPENDEYKSIAIEPGGDSDSIYIWGVVISVIRKL